MYMLTLEKESTVKGGNKLTGIQLTECNEEVFAPVQLSQFCDS